MRLARNAAAGAGLVIIIAAAAVIGILVSQRGEAAGAPGGTSDSRGPGSANAPGALGIATVTTACPAAAVPTTAAQCPAAPECWRGLVENAGNESAASAPCSAPHVWETFAIAVLPADARTWDYDTVSAYPAVRAVCSMRVLLESRVGPARRIPQRDWQVDVLPPDQAAFESGARAYRCVAQVLTGASPRTPQFGPRPGSGH